MLSRISIDYVSLVGVCFHILNRVCSLSPEAKTSYTSLQSFQFYYLQDIVYSPACTSPLFLSGMAAPEVNPQIKAQDKKVQWYQSDLETVSPQARELLENYSHILPDEVIPHILKIVSPHQASSSLQNPIQHRKLTAFPLPARPRLVHLPVPLHRAFPLPRPLHLPLPPLPHHPQPPNPLLAHPSRSRLLLRARHTQTSLRRRAQHVSLWRRASSGIH